MGNDTIKMILSIIIPIFTAFVSAVTTHYFNNKSFRSPFKRTKKLDELKSQMNFYEEIDTEYYKFIKKKFIEDDFYLQTGIHTDYDTIPKYIEFRNQIGDKYNWKQIKRARSYFSTISEQIEVSITKIENIIMWIFSVIGFLLIFAAVVFINIQKDGTLTEKLALLSLVFVSVFFGFAFIKAVDPIYIANQMKKSLIKSQQV
ncbi:hypothetical protein [Plebeiibacterium marinum]|uniref:Uncharacterized protein n=1 Tax=Plebeiibacterium marinum TaxID=2992111 RepID=A0AAE3MFK0_9BACT|nr:hypothetical protein [Plebeiobacterium marinum]MCW3807063.1 hypothetical protein [Plebeiobacterium marinum]